MRTVQRSKLQKIHIFNGGLPEPDLQTPIDFKQGHSSNRLQHWASVEPKYTGAIGQYLALVIVKLKLYWFKA